MLSTVKAILDTLEHGMSYQYCDIFEEEVKQFVENKTISLYTSIGYFAPSILTTTAFILANNGALRLIAKPTARYRIFTPCLLATQAQGNLWQLIIQPRRLFCLSVKTNKTYSSVELPHLPSLKSFQMLAEHSLFHLRYTTSFTNF